MTTLLPWILGAAAVAVVLAAFARLTRVSRVRGLVLEEVRRLLHGGVVENTPGHGPQARGRLGQLEIAVDLFTDHKRPRQSPLWRVLAVGPVRIERPIEVRAGGWQGWIDPWMQLARGRDVRAAGPGLEVHTEADLALDHPVLLALGRQGPALVPGSLYARPDLMRAEVRFVPSVDDNGGLFAYLHAMAEISEASTSRHVERAGKLPRVEIPAAGRSSLPAR